MVKLIKVRVSVSYALLGLFSFFSASGFASSCFEGVDGKDGAQFSYSVSLSDRKPFQRIENFNVDTNVAGLLVQSIALDRAHCTWVAAVSLSKKTNSVILAEFPSGTSGRSYKLYQSETLFSHPQDISASAWGDKTLFWLPSQDRKGVVGFTLHDGSVHEEFNFALFKTPIKGLSSAVDARGRYLAVQGYFRQGKDKQQMVRIYELRQLLDSDSALKFKDVKPIYEWPLDVSQQDSRQWRQGMAIYGSSLFVLSGNAKPSQEKFLVSYELNGRVISVGSLPNSAVGSFKARKSKTFEPEGLEVVSYNGEVGIAIGLAGGAKPSRSYELWFVPFKREK